MCLDDFTAAEVQQMYHERIRDDYRQSTLICSYIVESVRDKKSKPMQPDDINPMETTNTYKPEGEGVKLNSTEGFKALASIAGNLKV